MLELIVQLLANSIISGSLYMLLGFGWSLAFATTGTFHFAYAIIITASAYAASLLTTNAGLPLVVGLLGAMAVGILLGYIIEMGIYRPIVKLGGNRFTVFIGSLGIVTIGENLINLLFTPNRRMIAFKTVGIEIGPVNITSAHLFSTVLSIVIILALWIFLTKTTYGKSIRAVASNPTMAMTLGINVSRTSLLVISLGSAIGAVCGVLIGIQSVVAPPMGTAPLFAAFIVTFMGGIGSLPGAALAGLVLGLSENLPIIFMPVQLKVLIPSIVLIVVLIFKPKGFFGKTNQ